MNLFIKNVVVCLWLQLMVITASAQYYNYTHYTARDGLAGETVYLAKQDHDGFLWIGTESGLSRFDGKKFTNFTTQNGLPSNEIFGTMEDRNGRLWVLSFSNRLAYFQNGIIHRLPQDSLLSRLQFKQVIKEMSETTDGQPIVYDNSLQTAVINGNQVQRYPARTFHLSPYRLQQERWLNITMISLPQRVQAYLSQHFPGRELIKTEVFRINTHTAILCVLDWHNIIWDFRTNECRPIPDTTLHPQQMLHDHTLLSVQSGGGAGIYDDRQQRVIQQFLPQYIINSAYEDREQNLWFSTNGNGLYKLGALRISTYPFTQEGLSPIQYLHTDGTQIFVGGDKDALWSLTKTDPGAGSKLIYHHKTQKKVSPKHLMLHAQRQLLPIRSKTLGIPGIDGFVKSIHIYEDTLLVASHARVIRYYPKGQTYVRQLIYPNRATTAIRHDGRYYIGTLDKLLILDEALRVVGQPLHSRISGFACGSGSDLWVATYDQGVYKLEQGVITDSLNMHNAGLNSNLCRSIYSDSTSLWIGTDQGVHQFAIGKQRPTPIRTYTTDDGLNSNIINAILVQDSVVYIGTPKGLNIFRLPASPPKPFFNLRFTDITLSGQSIPLESEPDLAHDHNHIRFSFAAISFSLNPVSYRYRINGLSPEWQHTSEPVLDFISLPSGTYTLEVQALHPLGYKSPLIQKKFRVRKALYEHWWFWMLGIIVFGTAVLTLLQYRIRSVKRKAEEKAALQQRVMELEQMALRAQMNPHFIFNCLNSIQHYVLKQDVQGANLYLSRFATLVRETLEHSPKIYITLQEEINYLSNYIELEQLQVNQPFQYTISLDPHIQPGRLLFPNMLLQPLVENAIKHGLHIPGVTGVLQIRIRQLNADTLQCTIEDNGPGRNHSRKRRRSGHNSQGMILVQKRIDTLNLIRRHSTAVSISITDVQAAYPQGTRVTINLPLTHISQSI